MVTPLMPSYLKEKSGFCPLTIEVLAKMREVGGSDISDTWFDPTMLKCVLEDMAIESGADIMYHTTFVDAIKDGQRVTHLIVNNKDGLTAYAARYFIDCSGDADVAIMARAQHESGDANGVNQPLSLRFEVAGIEYEKFYAYLESIGQNPAKYFAMNTRGMEELFRKAHEDGLLSDQDASYIQGFGLPGKADSMSFNCPELTPQKNIVDAKFFTKKQIEGKKAILRIRRFLRERIPGFENCYISEIAGMVGIRESRRIKAEYIMTIYDIVGYKKFNDAVTESHYPVDVHGPDYLTLLGETKYDTDVPPAERYWEVPFKCMIPLGIDNMLVAGRCAGFDFVAQSAARIQIICRAMGEAAGRGTALASKNNAAYRDIDYSVLKNKLIVPYNPGS